VPVTGVELVEQRTLSETRAQDTMAVIGKQPTPSLY